VDDLTKASFGDLIRRFRLAGDKYTDLRCVILHGLDFLSTELDCEFGELINLSIFRPDSRDDHFTACYYRESSRPSPFNRHKLPPIDRNSELVESARPIQKTLASLFSDAMWLASKNGFAGIPGCKELDLERLYRSETTWLCLLFHSAWSCPSGSLLRAKRWYPESLITRLRLRDLRCREAGYSGDEPASMSDAYKLRDEIAARNSKLTKKERESEWAFICNEERSQQQEKVAAGEYMSILPLDPFTASAALLELMLNFNSTEGESANGIPAL